MTASSRVSLRGLQEFGAVLVGGSRYNLLAIIIIEDHRMLWLIISCE